MEVAVLSCGEGIEYPNGIPTNMLAVMFTCQGVEFATGLEMNLSLRFSQARLYLRRDGQKKAVRRMDRYMRLYNTNRMLWN